MPGGLQDRPSIARVTERISPRLVPLLPSAGEVTVLLLMVVATGFCRAQEAERIDLRVFEFTSDFHVPMGQGHLEGIMASDGSQHRIAVYWAEPAAFRESASFLRYGDFIVARDVVHYWIQGVSRPGTFQLSGNPSDPLLPRRDSIDSVVRSALAILGSIGRKPEDTGVSLEVSRFFREGRGQAEYTYEASPEDPNSQDMSGAPSSDVEILNALPYGRKYSKEKPIAGALVWRARRALDGRPLVSVTVKLVEGIKGDLSSGTFDPSTLGHWALIPDPYKAYWSFDGAYSQATASGDQRTSSHDLYDRVESYIENTQVPAPVSTALNRLRFKIAMATGDTARVSRSSQAAVAGLCRRDVVDGHQGLLELARMAEQIQREYPRQADELLRPLVGQLVKSIGPDPVGSVQGLMAAIDANRWLTYGKLLIEEVRSQGLADPAAVDALAAGLEARRLARELQPPDPCDSMPTVKQYLEGLDLFPPRGAIDTNDLRQILEKGLARHCRDGGSQPRHSLVEDVMRTIRLTVGEGPFRGDQAQLIEAIERFSGLYLTVDKNVEPIDTVLATFLALSFCDTSTPQDHDVLFSQFHSLCLDLQSEVNGMLGKRGLASLVAPEDVNDVFHLYERLFRRYIDDPLWPTFKFPWTANEQARIAHKLRLGLVQLGPLLDEMSLKFKYGGGSAELRRSTAYEISRAAQQLLPEAAFLRKPPYPGVSCQYRANRGFTAVIAHGLYEDAGRVKGSFKAMRYFHLGHRLEEIVRQQREPAWPAQSPSEERVETGT